MKQKYRLFRRANGVFYSVDNATKKQESLGTKNKEEGLRLLNAKNEAERQPSSLNLQLGHVFLRAGDPTLATRTWQQVMDEMAKCKTGVTRERWERGVREQPFDLLRNITLLETRPEQFIQVLSDGTVSTNIFLRRLHNFAIDVGWLHLSPHSSTNTPLPARRRRF
jgi:hypothetical protein